jgi:cell division protein FtsB
VQAARPIFQKRNNMGYMGGVGMNWVADLITGLRDIAIVVFLGYGLNLIKQQNELLEREKALKQSEIDVHKAEIEVHKSNIERLKATQAPAIAHDLEQMTRTANSYAEASS